MYDGDLKLVKIDDVTEWYNVMSETNCIGFAASDYFISFHVENGDLISMNQLDGEKGSSRLTSMLRSLGRNHSHFYVVKLDES